ncbi:MAG: hypothetical protein ACR2LX_17315 [Jatrophihabitans sp.]
MPVHARLHEDKARFYLKPDAVYAHPELRPEDVYTRETMAEVLSEAAGDILAHFAASELTPYEALTQLCNRAVWHEPALATMTRFADFDRTSCHYRSPGRHPERSRPGPRVFHSAEIVYLFGQVAAVPGYDAVDQAVSHAVQHVWVTR